MTGRNRNGLMKVFVLSAQCNWVQLHLEPEVALLIFATRSHNQPGHPSHPPIILTGTAASECLSDSVHGGLRPSDFLMP